MGLADLAVRHLRAAVHANLALGHWPAALHSRYRLGQALTRSDDRQTRADGAQEQAGALAEAVRRGWTLPGSGREQTQISASSVIAPAAEAAQAAEASPTPRIDGRGDDTIVVQRYGGRWALRWHGRTAEVHHCVGMLYLSLLLARPGQDIAAAELAGGQVSDQEVRADAAATGSQPVVDADARRSYRRRLGHLERELQEATARHDDGRLDRLRRERDWITAELAAGSGPGGHRRVFTSNAERARIAVGKAIRRALDRLADADTEIGEELRRSIQMGANCCYRPQVSTLAGIPMLRVSGAARR
jgi:hypothetical protein